MQTPQDMQKRNAISALIKLAVMEGALLCLFVGAYLYTGNLSLMIGGVVGVAIIFAPLFLRWAKEHGASLKTKPGEGGHG